MSRGRCLLLPRRQARLGGVVLRAQGTCRASAVGGPGDESRVQPGICDAHLALKSSRAAGAMVYPLLKGVGVGREPEAGSTCGGPGALGFRGFCWGKLRRLGTQHLAGPSWGTCRWVYKVGAAIGAAHFIRGLCWGEPRRPGAQNPPGPTWKGLPLSAKGALVLARLVPHLLQLGSWRWLEVQHLYTTQTCGEGRAEPHAPQPAGAGGAVHSRLEGVRPRQCKCESHLRGLRCCGCSW